MFRTLTRFRKSSIIYLAIIVILWALLSGRLIDNLYRNYGYISLSKGLISGDERDLKKAEKIFRQVLSSNPTSQPVKKGVSLALLRQFRIKEAVSEMEEMNISSADYLLAWGLKAKEEGNLSEASTWFRVATTIDQDNGQAWCYLGKTYAGMDHNVEAKGYYKLAVESGFGGCVNLLAMHYFDKEQYHRAIPIWEKAIANHPGYEGRKEWLLNLIFALLKVNMSPSALVYTEQALKEYPQEARFYFQKGVALYKSSGDADQAINVIKQAIELNSEFPGSYRAIGDILFEQARYSEAVGWYSEAIQREPRERSWYISRAKAAHFAGNPALAKEFFQVAIERFPAYPDAFYEKAGLHLTLNEVKEAEETINEALALMDEPSVPYLSRAGKIFLASGKEDRAREMYLKVLSIDPDHEEARSVMSRLENE